MVDDPSAACVPVLAPRLVDDGSYRVRQVQAAVTPCIIGRRMRWVVATSCTIYRAWERPGNFHVTQQINDVRRAVDRAALDRATEPYGLRVCSMSSNSLQITQ